MDTKSAVKEFVADYCDHRHSLASDDDIFQNARISGDDADDFMFRFAESFDVDMTSYRWYFHHTEEGYNLGGVFFKSPDRHIDHIPITITLLAEAAHARQWQVEYPTHELPRVRKDILINQLMLGVGLLGMTVFLWARFVS